jgi:hypothetical protein
MAGARREGDAEKLALYQREYFEVLRQAKRGNRTRSEEP